MRAIIHNQTTQSVLLDPSHPTPEPSANEVLLKVSATALTTGELLWPRPAELNESYPGVEMAGTVVTSPVSSKLKPGNEVYMRTTYPRSGSAREFSIGLEDELALKPKNVDFVEAAAVPVSALTAWQGLFVHAGIPFQAEAKKTTVLVNGASGGVGVWYTQLAHLADCYVVAVCSSKNSALLKSLGADIVIEYDKMPLKQWLLDHKTSFDHVFDCVGLDRAPVCWHAAKADGRVWTIVPPADMQWKFELDPPASARDGVAGRFFVMESSGEQLGQITKLIEENKVRPVVDSVWSLEDFKEAFQRLYSGRAVGKVVLRVAP